MCSSITAYVENISYCYIAGIFSPTVRAFIGYFEVTWHPTMKLFPDKISQWVTLAKSMTSEGNSALLPANVDRRPPFTAGFNEFPVSNFPPTQQVPRETKLTIFLGTSHCLLQHGRVLIFDWGNVDMKQSNLPSLVILIPGWKQRPIVEQCRPHRRYDQSIWGSFEIRIFKIKSNIEN